MKFITFDLDSTLYDTSGRDPYIDRTGDPQWARYSMLCVHDVLIEGAAAVIRLAASAGVQVHYVTGRNEAARALTLEVLERDGLPVDGLWMDESESGDHVADYGSHAHYKLWRIQKLIAELDGEHLFHTDDYASVSVLLSEAGIPCVCVKKPEEVLEGARGLYV